MIGVLGQEKKLWAAACILIVMLAVAWTAAHLPFQAEGKAAYLREAYAAGRAQERMPIQMPHGDVFINTATVNELCELKGVGASLAEMIIAERNANGNFYFPEDLLAVKGIGPKKLAGFIDQITLESE